MARSQWRRGSRSPCLQNLMIALASVAAPELAWPVRSSSRSRSLVGRDQYGNLFRSEGCVLQKSSERHEVAPWGDRRERDRTLSHRRLGKAVSVISRSSTPAARSSGNRCQK